VVCIAPPAPTEKMSKNTEADASYDQNIGSMDPGSKQNIIIHSCDICKVFKLKFFNWNQTEVFQILYDSVDIGLLLGY